MKKILFLLAFLSAVTVQAQVVSNVRAMQQDTTLVVVYDLKNAATTKLEVSFDGGLTFIPANSVSGDINKTLPGNNRIVYWNATKDVGYFDCDKMVFKITASGRNLNTYANNGVSGHAISYKHYRVYQDGSDITPDYKNFLRNNCPQAYRAYQRRWHGMFWGGLATTICMIPFTMGAIFSDNDFGMGACFGLMSTCIVTGIPLMCCSTVSARKQSAKVYNNTCGLLDMTSLQNTHLEDPQIKLSFTPTTYGLGLSLQF